MPFLQELEYLPFYWGKLSYEEVERILSKKPKGSFLMRLASDGYLALSVRTDDPRNVFQEYVPYGVKKTEKDSFKM